MLKHLINHIVSQDKKKIQKYLKNFSVEKNATVVYETIIGHVSIENQIIYIDLFKDYGVHLNYETTQYQAKYAEKLLHYLNSNDKTLPIIQYLRDNGLTIPKDSLKNFFSSYNSINETVFEFLHNNGISFNFENNFLLDCILQRKKFEEFKLMVDYHGVSVLDTKKLEKLATQEMKDYYTIYKERQKLNIFLNEDNFKKNINKL